MGYEISNFNSSKQKKSKMKVIKESEPISYEEYSFPHLPKSKKQFNSLRSQQIKEEEIETSLFQVDQSNILGT